MATNNVKRIDITRPKIESVDENFKSDNSYLNMFYKEISNLDTNIPLFYKNLRTLTFEKDESLCTKKQVAAYYYPAFNKIVTNSKEEKQQLSHELLHMASSIVTDDFTYIGFYQKSKKDGWQVGEALNEGFTNSLDCRLFKDIIPCKEKTTKEVYPISTRICDNLEFTLETKRLLDSYFKADLKTIYEYLSRLMGKDATLAFLYSYDALFGCCDDCSKKRPFMLRLLYPDIDIYVAEAFYTKITDKYRSGALDSASYKDYLEVVREILMDRIYFDKIPITPKVIGAYPYIEERYNKKYKAREKNNCLIK